MGRTQSDAASEPFRLDASVSHLLHRAEQLAGDRFTRLMGDRITLRQVAVLAALAETPGLSQNDLVRTTGIDRSTMADMLKRLQRRNWITRAASTTDKRAYTLRLSAQGAAILEEAAPHAKEADATILAALTKPKRKALLAALAKLAAAADEKAEREARKRMKRETKEKEKARKRRTKLKRSH